MSVGESGTYNRYVGDSNGAYTGIVNKTLTTNGYPTMAADKGLEPLDYLFGGKPDDEAVTNYEPTGGLLALDENGYYGFDADSQYAAYNTTSKSSSCTTRIVGTMPRPLASLHLETIIRIINILSA